jgi:hypothetical protein
VTDEKLQKSTEPIEAYDAVLVDSMTEIAKLTGGLTQHLEWWAEQQPGNEAVIAGFQKQVAESRGKLPLPCFRTLVGLGTAMQRHVWTCWLFRDELPDELRRIAGYGRPN